MSPRKSDFVLVPSPEFDELLRRQRDRDAVTKIAGETACNTEDCVGECVADAILASDWLRERDALIWEAGFDYADERRDDIRAREDNPYRGEVVSPTE